jgi:flavin reductase (DIM6/NTAB) family NADH-FMN oxidoreductase RutF
MIIDLENTNLREFYAHATSLIAPRPIAFASTIDLEGNVNLSPFSFFNFVGIDPPILIFSPNRRGKDNSQKDTILNLQEVPEVVINLVDYSMVQQISLSSCEYPKGVNEFLKAGFTEEKSLKVKPPKVKESPVSLECKVLEIKEYGTANIVICEVLLAHINDSLFGENGKIDQQKTDWVARMGADWYARITPEAMFEVPKPTRTTGIGIDQIPDFIKFSKELSGNDLGKLGNIEKLPSIDDIENYKAENQEVILENKFQKAKILLEENKINEAWLYLLSMQKIHQKNH